jgi:demethylmenaquinone methyltransferase/2-methoxy-6-polyprenyl-1,4-benzoquinol methylase
MTKMPKIKEWISVEEKNKQFRPLQKMFTEVPEKYNLMNGLLTLRFDKRWRKIAARECLAGNPARILDLCTWTGELAINIARLSDGRTEIIGLDYSAGMLSIAQNKALKRGYDRISHK